MVLFLGGRGVEVGEDAHFRAHENQFRVYFLNKLHKFLLEKTPTKYDKKSIFPIENGNPMKN